MRTKIIIFCMLALAIGSCVPVLSLHPLYNEADTIFEPKLVGSWVDDGNGITMDFSRPEGEGKRYHFAYSQMNEYLKRPMKGVFIARLVKLGNRLFLDFFPEEFPNGDIEEPNNYKWYANAFFLVPGHTFAVVDSIEPQLKIRITNSDEMEDFLKKEPNAIRYENVSGHIILTTNTAELQNFVVKYADNRDVFCSELTLKRRR